MLDMESRLRPVRAVTMGALALGLLLCGPWIGFWTLAPLAGAAAAFVVAERVGQRIRYPEYAMMAAWIISQAAIAGGVALTGGPESPALVLLLIPVVSLSARFPQRGVVTGLGITLSFGVAGSTEGESFDYERVFADADAALLMAKREGRNRVRRLGQEPQPAALAF